MTVKNANYINRISQDTSRGPSAAIWGDCPWEDMVQNDGGGIGNVGYRFVDDFNMTGQPALNAASSMGQWACWADTASTLTDAGEEGGVLKVLNTSNPKQIVLSSNAGGFRMVSGATGFPLQQKLWFEARVAVSSITTGVRDLFVGLCDNTTTQICSANNLVVGTAGNVLITTPNLFGFHFRDSTNPTDVGLAFNVASGTVQYPTALQTLSLTVAGAALTAYAAVTNGNGTGFVKLGFVFDPEAGNVPLTISTASSGQTVGTVAKPLVKVYVNGQQCATFLTSTNVQASTFPTGRMAPCLAFGTLTNSAFAMYDWIRCAQLGSF